MGESSFQFKKFIVSHDKCAMKVSTDACVLGAYAEVSEAKKILDIGAGTGLLSLMAAQRSKGKIDAVEIDIDSFQQAQQNVLQSPFSGHIHVYHSDIKLFSENHKGMYDCIICNPPFYENQLRSKNASKNAALHSSHLTKIELFESIKNLASEHCNTWILIHADDAERLIQTSKTFGFFAVEQLNLHHKPGEKLLRCIFHFKKEEAPLSIKKLSVYDKHDEFSDEFRKLMKDYYKIF